jgi:hypothetical protein
MPSRAVEKLETKRAAKQVAPYPDQRAIGEPVRAARVATQIVPGMETTVSPGSPAAAAGGSDPDEDTTTIKLRGITPTVERIPWVGHSVAEWLSGAAPRRPRPHPRRRLRTGRDRRCRRCVRVLGNYRRCCDFLCRICFTTDFMLSLVAA